MADPRDAIIFLLAWALFDLRPRGQRLLLIIIMAGSMIGILEDIIIAMPAFVAGFYRG